MTLKCVLVGKSSCCNVFPRDIVFTSAVAGERGCSYVCEPGEICDCPPRRTRRLRMVSADLLLQYYS